MARMRATSVGDRQCVTISGHLTGRDLRRLEQICGSSLEQERLRLTLRLRPGSDMDTPARAFVERLTRRGAIVLFD